MLSMALSSQKMTHSLLVLLAFFASGLGWASVNALITRSASGWGIAIGAFSVLAIAFLCAALIFRDRKSKILFVSATLLPGLFFSLSFTHLAFVLLSGFLLLRGMSKVEEEMSFRLKLSLRKNMAVGMLSFSFVMALLISSAYYAHIRFAPWENLVPRFTLAQGSGDVLLRVMGVAYPELGKIRREGMTVDSFLQGVNASKKAAEEEPGLLSSVPEEMTPEEQALSEEMALSLGRLEMSKLAGRAISGDEKVSDVLTEAFRHKIVALVSGDKAQQDLPAGVFPFFLSVLLFVTILSLSSLLRWVWISGATLLMKLLIRLRVFSVERVPAEQEVLR